MPVGQKCQCGIADWPRDEQTSDSRRLRQSSYKPWNKNVCGIERTEMLVRLHAEQKQVFGNNSGCFEIDYPVVAAVVLPHQCSIH